MAYHESFWVVAGTSGPVLGLALVAESARAHRVVSARLMTREVPTRLVSVLLFLPIPVLGVELGALTFALQKALTSLQTEADHGSMNGVSAVLLAGWALLIVLITLEYATRVLELIAQRRNRPLPHRRRERR